VFDEMLPLFCKETVESGGLSWDTAQIGLSLSIGGLILCFYQPLVYPRLAAKLGVVNSYRAHTRAPLTPTSPLCLCQAMLMIVCSVSPSPVRSWNRAGGDHLHYRWRRFLADHVCSGAVDDALGVHGAAARALRARRCDESLTMAHDD
jgi:hypothetical protein